MPTARETVIVLMAGLPGTGKSAVARELAARLPAALLDKDQVRATLFSPELIEYSTRQDDFCMNVLLETAAYLLRHDRIEWVILDGRTFSQRYQLEEVAERVRRPVRIIECVCSTQTALRRLEVDGEEGKHPARNRDASLYRTIKARFEPIVEPKLLLDTERDLDSCVDQSLDYLGAVAMTP